MSQSPIYIPTNFIDDRSRYIFAKPDEIKYRNLPKNLSQFKYAMPPPQTRNFFILSYFHRGGDGRVALLSSESGNLAVIKFLNDDADNTKLQQEIGAWQDLWNVKCRIVQLNKRVGLLMPFCMPFHHYKVEIGERTSIFAQFSSLQSWSKRLSKIQYDEVSEELEECINFGILKTYQTNPCLAAKQALETMAQKLAEHNDLEFRHVALLPVFNDQTKLYDFKPILIDLTRISKNLSADYALKAANDGLEKLTNQLKKLQGAS